MSCAFVPKGKILTAPVGVLKVYILVVYYDFAAKRFKFRTRKKIRFSSNQTMMTVADIENNVMKRQFIPMEMANFSNYTSYEVCKRALQVLYNRWSNLEHVGWKVHPNYKYVEREKKMQEMESFFTRKKQTKCTKKK